MMNKNSLADLSGYILLKSCGFIFRNLPISFSFFLGRRLGDLFYFLDCRHRTIAYSNLKTALGKSKTPAQLSGITREFYRSFAQSLVEIFFIPKMDKEYFNKYIHIEGARHFSEGFKRGKGVILLAVHAGSWELANIICAHLGVDFHVFVRNQRYPLLNRLLNSYRLQKGFSIVQKDNSQLRKLVEIFQKNQAIGMTADQGGKTGTLVEFFGKKASMASGAVRLALKYDCTILPVFPVRIKGPYIKVVIEPPVQIKKTGDLEKDIQSNLANIIGIFQKYIEVNPKEYLWIYKVWKYAKEKTILILSDTKAGHLRQSQAVAKIADSLFKEAGQETKIHTIEIRYKKQFWQSALAFGSCLGSKYQCQGCLRCLRAFLNTDTYKSLLAEKPDMVISCGSSLAPVNFIIASENKAKSIVIMRPSILSLRKFDLVIMPRHDRPLKRKNIVVTEGALNLVDDEYLKLQVSSLKPQIKVEKDLVLGLLLGGDAKKFKLSGTALKSIFSQVKEFLEMHDGSILISTSRRTSRDIEDLVKTEFADYPRTKFLVIASEFNPPNTVGAILGLSKIILISPESISMISEAVNSKKYVITFDSPGLSKKHREFIRHFSKEKYIYLVKPDKIKSVLDELYLNRPQVRNLADNFVVRDAIKKII